MDGYTVPVYPPPTRTICRTKNREFATRWQWWQSFYRYFFTKDHGWYWYKVLVYPDTHPLTVHVICKMYPTGASWKVPVPYRIQYVFFLLNFRQLIPNFFFDLLLYVLHMFCTTIHNILIFLDVQFTLTNERLFPCLISTCATKSFFFIYFNNFFVSA